MLCDCQRGHCVEGKEGCKGQTLGNQEPGIVALVGTDTKKVCTATLG